MHKYYIWYICTALYIYGTHSMQGYQQTYKYSEQPCEEGRHTYPYFLNIFIYAYTHRNRQPYAERFGYMYKETLYG